jgi:hypothetical protein
MVAHRNRAARSPNRTMLERLIRFNRIRPPNMIRLAAWLYFRRGLSFRDVGAARTRFG